MITFFSARFTPTCLLCMGVQAFFPPFFPLSPSLHPPFFSPPYCVGIITFTSPLTTDTWTPTYNIFPSACFVWCTSCMSSPNLLLPPFHIFTGITLSPSNLSYHPLLQDRPFSSPQQPPPPITFSIYIHTLQFNTISPCSCTLVAVPSGGTPYIICPAPLPYTTIDNPIWTPQLYEWP